MRINPSSIFLIFLLLVMAAFIGIASAFSSFQSKLLPIIVCGLVFVLGAVQLRKDLSTRERATGGTSGEEQGKRESARPGEGTRLGISLSWLFGFSLGVYLLGFLVSIPAFIFCYMKLRRRSWVTSLATAAIATGLVYLIFEFALKADLWKGLILANLLSHD